MRKQYNDNGFTLLEVLISTTILSVVVAIIVQAFWLGSRSWEKGEVLVERELRLRTVVDLVSKQLRSVFPLVTKENGREILHFSGDSESVGFVTTVSLGYQRQAGLFYVNYFLDSGSDSKFTTLRVIQRPIYKEDPFNTMDKEDAIDVLPDILSARWDYYGEEEWLEEWDEERRDKETNPIPASVRLTLKYQDGKDVKVRETIIPVFAELREVDSSQLTINN